MMMISNKYYDLLKWISLILLPALAMLYNSLGPSLNLPYVTEVVATIAAVDTFIAALIGLSNFHYKTLKAIRSIAPSAPSDTSNAFVLFEGRTYDILLWIAQILLPATAAFYFSLSMIWPLPSPDQVVAVIMGLDTLLGVLLGFSSSEFYKKSGSIAIEPFDLRRIK